MIDLRTMTKEDFDRLHDVIDAWWGRPARALLDPVYLHQFGQTSLVAEAGENVVGFLVGFASQTDPDEAFVHLVATDPRERRKGIGSALYWRFFQLAKQKGCRSIRTVVRPDNREGVAFHERLGFKKDPDAPEEAYGGPGEDRVVYLREILA